MDSKHKKSYSTHNNPSKTNKTVNFIKPGNFDNDDEDNKTKKPNVQYLISNINSPQDIRNKIYKKNAPDPPQTKQMMPPLQQNHMGYLNDNANKQNDGKYFKHYPNPKGETRPQTVVSPKEQNPELVPYQKEILKNDLVKKNPQASQALNKVSTAQEFLMIIGYFQLLEDLKNKTKDLDKLGELQDKNAQLEEVIGINEKTIKKLNKENQLLSEQLASTRARENKLQNEKMEKRAISKSPIPVRLKKE